MTGLWSHRIVKAMPTSPQKVEFTTALLVGPLGNMDAYLIHVVSKLNSFIGLIQFTVLGDFPILIPKS